MAIEINISNISLQKSAGILLSASRYIILMTCFLTTVKLSAQSDLNLQDVVVGKVEVSATHSITLGPGFHAKEGSNFHAFIGSAFQPQNSTTTISSPSANATPVSGSSGNNYIKSITYREAKTTIPTGSFEHLEEIQYFDGLGRPIQNVQVGVSPSSQDIIQPFLYDGYGRDAIKTLPYTAAKSGEFRSGVTESTVNSYYSPNPPTGVISDSRAYTKIEFDNSPLNRVVSQTGPGSDWETNSKRIFTHYLSNSSSIPGWSVTSNYSYSSFTYAANTLYVTQTIDEDGHYSREYKDKLGQVVLKESQLAGVWLQTFYIYDDLGLLRCVMPPEATNPNTETDLCYYYLYDSRKRLTEKKLPGGGTIKMVYDARDRLRATQNSLQAPNNEWTFTKYDELNRPVITGTIINNGNIQSAIDAASMNEIRNNIATYYGYNNASYPTSGATVLTATYYDNYGFISGMSLSDSLNSSVFEAGNYNFASITDPEPKGYVTGMMSKVMYSSADNGSVPKSELFTATYYDKYGHVLRSISENQLKGKDVISNLYQDITNFILQTKQEHHKGSENITIEKWFEYDHTGRILATREKVNDQPEITSSAMKYNEIGEMTTKYLHSNQTSGTRTFIQEMNYQYNIRGWLTKINDPGLGENNDMFGLQLFYNTTTEMGSLAPGQGLYNGNIVGMKWGIKNEAIKGYQFSYDNLNRILQGNYAEGSSLNSNPGYYSETVGSYDMNGNILGLQRKYNNTLVDNLTYTYPTKSNKLLRIADSGTTSGDVDDYPGNSQDYIYDASGNMTYDGGKNLNIEYQMILNLPLSLNGQSRDLYYRYDATGRKLQKRIEPTSGTGTTINYIGNIVYEGGSVSYILTDNGRLIPEGTGSNRKFLYEYSMKDHLGNNRVTFMGTDLGGAVDIVQTTSYYPFGLVMSQMNGNTATVYTKNKYLYNCKELQSDNMTGEALNWYDYGARFYDPQIGRFHTIDPASELYCEWTPYNYVGNNPIRRTDPTGMIWADSTAANNQKGAAQQRINQYERANARLDKKMGKASEKGNGDRLSRLHEREGRNNSAIDELNASIDQIDAMGADQNNTFEFQQVSEGGAHYVTKAANGNIVIQYSSTEIQLHETRHAYQFMTDNGNNWRWDSQSRLAPSGSYNSMVNWGLSEQSGYRVQYSYNPSSMPNSSLGTPATIYDVTYRWVGGITGPGATYHKFMPYMNQYEKVKLIKQEAFRRKFINSL